jgi:hypothetical protein
LIEGAGFGIAQIESGYSAAGPKPMGFFYEGRARP